MRFDLVINTDLLPPAPVGHPNAPVVPLTLALLTVVEQLEAVGRLPTPADGSTPIYQGGRVGSYALRPAHQGQALPDSAYLLREVSKGLSSDNENVKRGDLLASVRDLVQIAIGQQTVL